jgi:hypothetical protein
VRLLAAIALTAATAFGQQKWEETELAETLMRQLVDFTAKALAEMDPNRPGFVPRHSSHTHDPPSYAMAFLYKTPHPLNPYYRKEEICNSAIAIGDRIVAEKMRPEWPLYLVCQVYNLLKNEIPEQKAQAWRAYAAATRSPIIFLLISRTRHTTLFGCLPSETQQSRSTSSERPENA